MTHATMSIKINQHHSMKPLFHSFRVLIFFIALIHGGYGMYQLQHFSATPVYEQKLEVQGLIVGVPHQTQQDTDFLLNTQQGLLKLKWYHHNLVLRPGQTWYLLIKLKPVRFFSNPGEFNYQKYLRREGIVAGGYVLPSSQNKLVSFDWTAAPIDYLRFIYEQKLLVLTKGMEKQGVLLALLLGDKSALKNQDKLIFIRSGISYFMVISGLHIVLFALFCTWLIRCLWALVPRLCLWLPAGQAGLAAGLWFSLLYGLLAGAYVPTQRAVIMLWIVGLAKLCYRQASSMRAWLYALLLVLAWNPYTIFSVAFWLSFLAVFFLIGVFMGRIQALSLWQEWILPQWLMYWALLPIIVYVFNQFSVLAIFTNLISVPLMMVLIIPLALLGAVLVLFSQPLALLAFKLSNWILVLLLQVLSYFAFSKYWGGFIPNISFFSMLLALFALILLFIFKAWPGRNLAWLALIPLLHPIVAEIPYGDFKALKINTANGVALLIKTHQHVILLQQLSNMRAAHQDLHYVLEPFLMQQGVKRIDLWVINSSANYHQLNALKNDWQTIEVNRIATAHQVKIYDSRFIYCGHNWLMYWDQLNFNLKRNAENKQCELKIGAVLIYQ